MLPCINPQFHKYNVRVEILGAVNKPWKRKLKPPCWKSSHLASSNTHLTRPTILNTNTRLLALHNALNVKLCSRNDLEGQYKTKCVGTQKVYKYQYATKIIMRNRYCRLKFADEIPNYVRAKYFQRECSTVLSLLKVEFPLETVPPSWADIVYWKTTFKYSSNYFLKNLTIL